MKGSVTTQQIMSRFRPIAPKPAAAAAIASQQQPPPPHIPTKKRPAKKRSPGRSPNGGPSDRPIKRCKSSPSSLVELKLLPDSFSLRSSSSPTSHESCSSLFINNEQQQHPAMTQLCLGNNDLSTTDNKKRIHCQEHPKQQKQVGASSADDIFHSSDERFPSSSDSTNEEKKPVSSRNLPVFSSPRNLKTESTKGNYFPNKSLYNLSGLEDLKFLELAYSCCQEPVAITNEFNQLLWCNPAFQASSPDLRLAKPVPISSFVLKSKARVVVWSFSGFTLQDASSKVSRPRPLRPTVATGGPDSFSPALYIPACVNSSV